MRLLKWLVALPAFVILFILLLVFSLPTIATQISFYISNRIKHLICWVIGFHRYDIYEALLVENLGTMRCANCQNPILKEDIGPLTEQKAALAEHINKMSEHLKTTKEADEISEELEKLV